MDASASLGGGMGALPPPPTRSALLSTYWRDPEFLAHVPLTTSTALEYFSRSNFFDPASTNEMLRMQNIGSVPPPGMPPGLNIPGWGKTPRQQEEDLARFKGVEFVLVHAREPKVEAATAAAAAGGEAGAAGDRQAHFPLPMGMGPGQQQAEDTLFVIQKRQRDGPLPTQVQVLETYYILNGNIHMAPDLDTILNNRLQTSLHSLRQALTLARSAKERPIDYSGLKTGARSDKKSQSGTGGKANTNAGTAEGGAGTLGAAGLSLKRDGQDSTAVDDDGLVKRTRLDAASGLEMEGGFEEDGTGTAE